MYGSVLNHCLDGWGTCVYPHLVLPEGDEQTDRDLWADDGFLRLLVLWRDLYALSLFLRVGSDAGQGVENVAPISRCATECVRHSDYVRLQLLADIPNQPSTYGTQTRSQGDSAT